MPQIPTRDQNPSGLHQRYQVTKTNGEETDSRAVYFVLRIDRHGRDAYHTEACRAAAMAYASHVRARQRDCPHLLPVANDLADLVADCDRASVDQTGETEA